MIEGISGIGIIILVVMFYLLVLQILIKLHDYLKIKKIREKANMEE